MKEEKKEEEEDRACSTNVTLTSLCLSAIKWSETERRRKRSMQTDI